MPRQIPRALRLHLAGRRAARLSPSQAANAWFHLAGYLEAQSLPWNHSPARFNPLLQAIRQATINARQPTTPTPSKTVQKNSNPPRKSC